MDRVIVACHDCDLLQRAIPLGPHAAAHCRRCGAVLYRTHPDGLDRSLACTLGAIVFFIVANAFPIVGLEVQGESQQTTLLGGVRRLYEQGMEPVAALVLFTTFLAPLAQLTGLAYLLLPLKFNRVPRMTAPVFRTLQRAQTWSMVDVFMLGVLVALVKLSRIASVVPGIALWSFGILMLLLAAALAAFDPGALWERTGVGP
jgi:paraquat-inducible protein A